jgi:hypothetical protein
MQPAVLIGPLGSELADSPGESMVGSPGFFERCIMSEFFKRNNTPDFRKAITELASGTGYDANVLAKKMDEAAFRLKVREYFPGNNEGFVPFLFMLQALPGMGPPSAWNEYYVENYREVLDAILDGELSMALLYDPWQKCFGVSHAAVRKLDTQILSIASRGTQKHFETVEIEKHKHIFLLYDKWVARGRP